MKPKDYYEDKSLAEIDKEICHDINVLRALAVGIFVLGFLLGALVF